MNATLAAAPRSVDLVRGKLSGGRLDRAAFDAILADVVHDRYSRVELAMFVLACALRRLDTAGAGRLHARDDRDRRDRSISVPARSPTSIASAAFPDNRTTLIVVPILASLGVKVPKTSSRAITSPAGTADTMGALAEVALSPERLRQVVSEVGACIAWGGALSLAPADDILITVERPMELDTEAQMVASILAKKKSVGATHVLVDIPVGPSAKVRTTRGGASARQPVQVGRRTDRFRSRDGSDSGRRSDRARNRTTAGGARCARRVAA